MSMTYVINLHYPIVYSKLTIVKSCINCKNVIQNNSIK